jgi:uncharacterized protein (DUF4415 family)
MPRTHKQIVGFPKLGPREPREIERLKKMPDSEIDYSDIPPAKPGGWVRGVDFLRAINPPLTLQLDPDVAAWLLSLSKRKDRSLTKGASSRANAVLRAAIGAKKSVPWDWILFQDLANTREAAGYLAEARKDSPAAYKRAVQNVAKVRRANPVQLAVPLDPDIATWLLSLGKRAPRHVAAILRSAMKASQEGK